MKTAEFEYRMPQWLIAQQPVEPRDNSRLLVYSRENSVISHRRFYDLPSFLREGDVLVLNDTRVLPARLYGKKESGARVEVLFLNHTGMSEGCPVWEALVRPARRLRCGHRIVFSEKLSALVIEELPQGMRRLKISCVDQGWMDDHGSLPLPPYITEYSGDLKRYQTVYADTPGAAAAPTAGLHFTDSLFSVLGKMGVETARLTLHVGLGTFREVNTETVEDYRIHEEAYEIPAETAETVNRALKESRRVIACGTTACRALESSFRGEVIPGADRTSLFIYPGYSFRVTGALITNFHLSGSSLIMLLSAFMGTEKVFMCYTDAAALHYRFYSFGDAMLVL